MRPPLVQLTQEHWKTALRLAEMSAKAYDDPTHRIGPAKLRIETSPGNDEMWIAIAGTDDFEDVMADAGILNRHQLNASSVGSHMNVSCHVHRGFWRYASQIFSGLNKELGRNAGDRGRVQTIRLGGHSLGAASCLLLMMMHSRLRGYTATDVEVHLYGCPRVGSTAWPNFFERMRRGTRVFRYVAQGDPVTKMPWAIFGWRHVGIEVMLPGGWDMEPDHPIKNYIREIRRKVETA